MYGSTKVGIVREDVSALAAPPASQPDGHTEDHILKHNPKSAAAHVMRRKSVTGLATRAQLNVTRTICPRALDTPVVLSHLGFSFRVRQADAHHQTSYCLGGVSAVHKTELAPLFLRAPADAKKRGGVQERLYTGGVIGGVQPGLLLTSNPRFTPVIPVS